ncbi:hypothetical protein CC77DRAFT_1051261 [Alternaria alternata]|uniref:Methyltransferase n=1 Tax=Alternaria alternata TaxID=5599 RepID=A0A177DK43_ALTAL|nr:hypothetical protein CC77DRAFT_1051261 [Alternaria alternata]OAG19570.1 hypothetical protein CC77DRAFT_1051261 [Alternaria alternata]
MPNLNASLCFLAPLPKYKQEKPYRIIPGADEAFDHEISNVVPDIQDGIQIVDIRDRLGDFNIEDNGFEVLSHTTSFPILDERSQVDAYKSEVEQLLKERLAAEKVIVFDFRHRIHREFEKGVVVDYNDPTTKEGPAIMAHSDHTLDSGTVVINSWLSEEDKTKYLTGEWRIRLMNTWRPLVAVIEDQPLALCDPRTVAPEDLFACDRVVVNKLGEVYLMRYDPRQRWYWLSSQKTSEPYVFLTWDSKSEGQPRLCPHTSFAVPVAPDVPPRESVETRSIVISRA